MKEREVTEEEAETVIRDHEYLEQSVKGRQNAFKFMSDRFLRVTFKEESDSVLVITVAVRKRPFRR
ncbi:MAG: hypothetical protein HY805_08855 [Nitrospirae bacterium]|nr:hypothetical protein [Nitrospirota bacterium]